MLKAQDIMTKNVISTGPEVSSLDAIKILLENKISGMPVNANK